MVRKVAVSPSFAAALSFSALCWLAFGDESGASRAKICGKWPKNSNCVRSRRKWPDVSGRADVGPGGRPHHHLGQCGHVEPMIVKTVEETAVPGDVIFAAAAKRERPVEALGEVGDGRLALELAAPDRRRRRADDRVRPKACRAARRLRRREPSLVAWRAPSRSPRSLEERISARRVGTWPALSCSFGVVGRSQWRGLRYGPIYRGADAASRNVRAIAPQMC